MDFTTSFIAALEGSIPEDYLPIIDKALRIHCDKFDIQPKCRDLSTEVYQYPSELKAYLVTGKIEGKSEKTLLFYKRHLERFLSAVAVPLDMIDANTVRVYLYNYQEQRKISDRYLDKIRQIIKSFFGWCYTEEYIPKDIARQLKPIRYEVKREKALTSIELEKVRQACTSLTEKAIVEFLYSTACRASEFAILRRSDIDLDAGTVHLFGKGKKHRTSYLNAASVILLKRLWAEKDSEWAFPSRANNAQGKPISVKGLQKVIGNIGRRAGIEGLHPHRMRRTAATMALERGMDVTEIQLLLGHANINTTMIYATASEKQVQSDHKKYI